MDEEQDDHDAKAEHHDDENNGPCYFEKYGHPEYGGEG